MPASGSQDNLFSWLAQVIQRGDAHGAFSQLAERLRLEKQYRQLFDLRLMQKRLELGLPLVSQPALGDLPKEIQRPYQDGYVQAAREVGALYLADGDIPHAWPYFRAVGDTRPIAQALETFDAPQSDAPESRDRLGSTIQVAFQEGVNPRKGFELILKHHGLCRAITMFNAYPQPEGRNESLCLLVRSLHRDLVDNLKRAISGVEEKPPEGDSISALIAGRDWLFEHNAQHTDSSHIGPVLKFCADLHDEPTLRLAVEIADYASRLGPMFQYSDDPPFERVYEDRGLYLRALVGEEVDRAIAYFEGKASDSISNGSGSGPGEVLVALLVQLGRYGEAIKAYRRYLIDVAPDDLSCPSLLQLCQMAGDFEQLKQVAIEQSDPLSYVAALLQESRD